MGCVRPSGLATPIRRHLKDPPSVKVLHVIPSLSPRYGGPSTVLPIMARALVAEGVEIDVATIDDGDLGVSSYATLDFQPGGYRRIAFALQAKSCRIALSLGSWLQNHVSNYDVVHIHAVFTYSTLAACRAARRNKVPYIVRPLGILNSWGMENRRRRLKKIWFRLLEKPLLDQAAGIHYTSTQERDDAARLHIKSPAYVLPLALDLGEFHEMPPATSFLARFPQLQEKKILLYLSRIHPKKGFDLLFPAFAELLLRFPDVRLVIGGDGDATFIQSLHLEAKRLQIESAIIWAGFMDSEVRLEALAAADVFCLPSWSENFGVALLEAMAASLPCVATDQVALAVDAASEQAVKMIQCDAEELQTALFELLNDADLRRALGERGARYAQDHHGMSSAAKRLRALYESIS